VETTEATRRRIAELLHGQWLAVLSTHFEGAPYASLVGFAAETDLSRIYFATPETTRKFRNIQADSRVALLVDSRAHRDADFHEAAAVTVVGTAEEIDKSADREAVSLYLARHPYLADFIHAPTTRLLGIRVERYLLVEHFQQVMELRMRP
jgi:nitroimidazol reductase NimA-like FMN-containing flavoprotein (pyridoxamine 5'-phosphate oxidase superfamily)